MRLGEELAAHPVRPLAVGVEQLVHEAFARLAPAIALARGELAQIHRVALEVEQRKPGWATVDLLPVAVEQDEARTLIGLNQEAALGHHGDRPLLLAGVVHEDAVERSALAVANVNRDALGQRVERAFFQQKRRMLAAQDELPLLELPVADGHDVHADCVGGDDDERGHHQRGLGERPLVDARCAQADQFAVDGEPVVDEEQ